MATKDSKIIEIPIQLSGEAKPMTESERETRRIKANKLVAQAEVLARHGKPIRVAITPLQFD